MAKYWTIVAVVAPAWLVLLVSPGTLMPVGYATYLLLVGVVAWSALRRRQPGWRAGAAFALLLLTLPAWVWGLYLLFERIRG